MALLHIPFVAGESDKIDRKILPNGTLRRVENLRLRQTGRLGKRNGLTEVPLTVSAIGTGKIVQALPPDRRAILGSFRYNLLRAGGANELVIPDGNARVPQLLPESAEGFSDVQSGAASFDETTVLFGNFQICAARFEATHGTAASANSVLVVQIRDLKTKKITDHITFTGYRRPRLIAEVSGFVLVIENFAAATVRATRYSINTVGVVTQQVALTTVFTQFAASSPIWDASLQSGATNFLVAVQTANNTISVAVVRMSDLVSTSTATVAPGVQSFYVTVCGNTTKTWLIWKTAATTAIDFRTYSNTLGGASATIALVATSSGTTRILSAVSPITSSAWVVWDTTGLGTTGRSLGFTDISIGGVVSTLIDCNLYAPASRPFSIANGEICVLAVCDGDLTSGAHGTLYRNVVVLNLSAAAANGANNNGLAYVEAEHGYGFADENDSYVGTGPVLWLSDASFSNDLVCVAYSYATSALDSQDNPASRRGTHPLVLIFRSSVSEFLNYQLPSASGVLGGAAGSVDDGRDTSVGFRQAPIIRSTAESNGAGLLTATGVYVWQSVWEGVFADGSRIFSEPSPPIARTLTGVNDTVTLICDPCPWAGCTNTRLHVYRTLSAGTILFEIEQSPVSCPAGTDVTVVDLTSDANLAAGAILYTNGGTLPNRPIPPARWLWRGDDRLVVGGFDRDVVRFSKLFLRGEGVAFADHEAFEVTCPEDVEAAAQLDGVWILFGKNGIYAVTGEGPDDTGNGSFSTPRSIPGAMGIRDWRSVVVTPFGIFFQSQRGIELLPRGFGAPTFVGADVQDVLNTYSEITCALMFSRGMNTDELTDLRNRGETSVLFLCRSDADDVVALIYDCDKQQWFRDTFATRDPLVAQVWQDGTLFQAFKDTASGWLRVYGSGYSDDTAAVPTFTPSVLETGSIRPGGMVKQMRARRAFLLGEYRSSCSVTLEMSIDDGKSYPYSRVFDLTAGYAAGDTLRLPWRLPVQLSESFAFRISDSSATPGEGAAFTGISLEVEPRRGMTRARSDAA